MREAVRRLQDEGVLDPQQRALLGPPARVPALAIERLATWQTTPVEWRHGLVRADRFSYVARWSAQDKGASFEPLTLGP